MFLGRRGSLNICQIKLNKAQVKIIYFSNVNSKSFVGLLKLIVYLEFTHLFDPIN